MKISLALFVVSISSQSVAQPNVVHVLAELLIEYLGDQLTQWLIYEKSLRFFAVLQLRDACVTKLIKLKKCLVIQLESLKTILNYISSQECHGIIMGKGKKIGA